MRITKGENMLKKIVSNTFLGLLILIGATAMIAFIILITTFCYENAGGFGCRTLRGMDKEIIKLREKIIKLEKRIEKEEQHKWYG